LAEEIESAIDQPELDRKLTHASAAAPAAADYPAGHRGRNWVEVAQMLADSEFTASIRIAVDLDDAAQMLEEPCTGSLWRNDIACLHSHR
jgi:hypothetical protein